METQPNKTEKDKQKIGSFAKLIKNPQNPVSIGWVDKFLQKELLTKRVEFSNFNPKSVKFWDFCFNDDLTWVHLKPHLTS